MRTAILLAAMVVPSVAVAHDSIRLDCLWFHLTVDYCESWSPKTGEPANACVKRLDGKSEACNWLLMPPPTCETDENGLIRCVQDDGDTQRP